MSYLAKVKVGERNVPHRRRIVCYRVAPKEKNWDHRRQTATIYWVDAQWNLPPPTIVRIDRREPAVLTTTLMRVQNIGPIEGWLVCGTKCSMVLWLYLKRSTHN